MYLQCMFRVFIEILYFRVFFRNYSNLSKNWRKFFFTGNHACVELRTFIRSVGVLHTILQNEIKDLLKLMLSFNI